MKSRRKSLNPFFYFLWPDILETHIPDFLWTIRWLVNSVANHLLCHHSVQVQWRWEKGRDAFSKRSGLKNFHLNSQSEFTSDHHDDHYHHHLVVRSSHLETVSFEHVLHPKDGQDEYKIQLERDLKNEMLDLTRKKLHFEESHVRRWRRRWFLKHVVKVSPSRCFLYSRKLIYLYITWQVTWHLPSSSCIHDSLVLMTNTEE